jgi:hypothetical protein
LQDKKNNNYLNRLKGKGKAKAKAKPLAIASMVLIIALFYGIFFYLQKTTEMNIRNSIFEQQKALQMQTTRALSQRISSDLSFMMARLQGLADSLYLQQGDLSTEKTKSLLQEIYFQINNITTIDRLFVVNKNFVVMCQVLTGYEKIVIHTSLYFPMGMQVWMISIEYQ